MCRSGKAAGEVHLSGLHLVHKLVRAVREVPHIVRLLGLRTLPTAAGHERHVRPVAEIHFRHVEPPSAEVRDHRDLLPPVAMGQGNTFQIVQPCKRVRIHFVQFSVDDRDSHVPSRKGDSPCTARTEHHALCGMRRTDELRGFQQAVV